MLDKVQKQRKVESVVTAKRQASIDPDLAYVDPSIVSKLDLTDLMGQSAGARAHTEVMEAACIAVIQVGGTGHLPYVPYGT